MTLPTFDSPRFRTESGWRVAVQVPQAHAAEILAAVREKSALTWGDYDTVSFESTAGIQRFRSLGTGHNPASDGILEVPCVELSFFLPGSEAEVAGVLEAIYGVHPYEEPVLFVVPAVRSLHIRGMDEDNPNRFWNGPPRDWVIDPKA